MLVARERGSETWGIVFERLEGAGRDDFRVHRVMYNIRRGSGETEEEPSFQSFGSNGAASNGAVARVRGPAGELAVTRALIEERDLRPGWVTAEGVASSRFSVLVRAYLSEHPQAFWLGADEAAALLSFDGEAQILVDTDAFEHTLGSADEAAAFQSLARAVAARDPSQFDPGTPNTDWRLHARFRPEHE
jgi:hypothetical protein